MMLPRRPHRDRTDNVALALERWHCHGTSIRTASRRTGSKRSRAPPIRRLGEWKAKRKTLSSGVRMSFALALSDGCLKRTSSRGCAARSHRRCGGCSSRRAGKCRPCGLVGVVAATRWCAKTVCVCQAATSPSSTSAGVGGSVSLAAAVSAALAAASLPT
jgi:hypothetical protein